DFLQDVERRRGREGASAVLKEKGIPGIKYSDGFSRGKDGGTSNFVIFDDRLINISKKLGVSIPIASEILREEERKAGVPPPGTTFNSSLLGTI
ncbi:MAG: hypothetical protein CL963_00005, partial [Euryarchaeota archaeon]|nr:hypothetical protein [Euryarchaeota archaeon]